MFSMNGSSYRKGQSGLLLSVKKEARTGTIFFLFFVTLFFITDLSLKIKKATDARTFMAVL
jgi:hypothetical protein